MANFNNNLVNYRKVTSLDNTKLEYNFEKISTKVDNVIKIVFSGSFVDNIETAYDPATSSGFATNYLETDTKYIVKQLNENGEVSATGIALRFIPGDKEQTLYIKVLSGKFDPQYGVIFYNGKDINGNPLTEATQVVNSFSYGSSIKEVRNALNVQKITCYYDTSGDPTLHYTQGPTTPQPEYHFDYGEFPTSGTIRISKPTENTLNNLTSAQYITTGKILAKIVATGTVALIVELNEKLKQDNSITTEDSIDYGTSANRYYIEELQTIPCARYRIDVVETLSTSSNAIQEITFNDKTINSPDFNFEYIPTISGESYNTVIQYKYDQTILVENVETAVPIEANVIAWNPVTKQLYVQCKTSPLDKTYGKVYQLNQNGGAPNTNSLGGNGYNLIKTDLTPKSGIFINISDTYNKALGDFESGTRVAQQVNELSNWFPELNYFVGEEVRQYRNGTSYISGRVKSWFNPQTIGEALINPPKLVIQLPSNDTDDVTTNILLSSTAPNFSTWASKILPARIAVEDRAEWKYDLSQSLVLGSKLTTTPEQVKTIAEQEIITKRTAGSNDIPSSYYTYGAAASSYIIANCLIKQFQKKTVANNPNLYEISILDIKLRQGETYQDLLDLGVSITDNSNKILFNAVPESYSNIIYKFDDNPYQTGLNEIIEGDVLYNDSDELMGKVVNIKRQNGNSSIILERELHTPVTKSGKSINKALKNNSSYEYTLTNSISITGATIIKPNKGLHFINPTKEGLTRSLQNGNYFEVVKTNNTSQAIQFTKCFSGSHTGTGSITLATNFPTVGISGGGHYILYKSSGSTTPQYQTIPSGDISYSGSNLRLNLPAGISIAGRYLVTVSFAAALNGFSRTKNLEPASEQRTLKSRSNANGLMEVSCYLLKSDVYSIDEIKLIGDANQINIKDWFELDNNETPEMYRFSKLILKPSKYSEFYSLAVPGSTLTTQVTPATFASNYSLLIKYNYFFHTGDGVILESYTYGLNNPMELKDIPISTIRIGNEYQHKSALIDFRPYMSIKSGVTISESTDPDADIAYYDIKPVLCPNNKFIVSNTYYAGRIDNLYLNKNGVFILETGTPSKYPEAPAYDSKKGMIVYKIAVSGYTYSLGEIKTLMVENKRYTMRDIGKLEKRIQNLEYYTTLSLLEQEANALSIVDADGFTREKMGILTDSFTGHSVGDIIPEYNACMNTSEGYLTAPTKSVKLPVTEYNPTSLILRGLTSSNSNGDRLINTGLYQLPHDGVETFIYQPLMTNALSVTGLDIAVYDGLLFLDPPVDDWVDTKTKPPLRVNLDGNSEAINQMAQALFNNNISPFGTVYGDWSAIPGTLTTQNWRGRTWARQRDEWEENRTIDRTFMTTSTSEVDLGERITDIDIAHYLRPQTIYIKATGLKPNTRFYVFFDSVKVDEFCDFRNTSGAAFASVVSQTIIPKTDKNGEVEINFKVPQGKFRTGEKQITVTDSPRNDKGNKYTLMYATAAFASSGLTITKETTIGTVRNFEMQHTRDFEERTQVRDRTWTWDPIAQTFFVNELEYPEGLYLESVDLMFENKDETIPVKVEVRPTVNGYPDISKIHPGGVSIMRADQVKTTGDSTPSWSNVNHITNFKFDYPVYLPPGEHCIMIKTNSKRYTIWAAQMGNTTVGSNPTLVTDQPELGVFFRSANASTWEPDGTVDLSFKLKKYYWNTGTSKNITFIPTASSSQFTASNYDLYQNTFENGETNSLSFDIVNVNSQIADFDSCKVAYTLTYSPKFGGSPITLQNIKKDTNLYLTKSGKLNKTSASAMNGSMRIIASFTPTNRNVVPMFDLGKSGITFVRNMVDTTEVDGDGVITGNFILPNELAPTPQLKLSTLNNAQPATVRYLTRTVTLEEESTAKNIKVGLTAYLPAGSAIKVFVKTGNTTDNTGFNNLPYKELQYTGTSFISTSISDYRAMDFELPEDIDLFNKFKIKICIFTTDSTSIPRVKDMRAFAVI